MSRWLMQSSTKSSVGRPSDKLVMTSLLADPHVYGSLTVAVHAGALIRTVSRRFGEATYGRARTVPRSQPSVLHQPHELGRGLGRRREAPDAQDARDDECEDAAEERDQRAKSQLEQQRSGRH